MFISEILSKPLLNVLELLATAQVTGTPSTADYEALVRPLDGGALPSFDYDALVRPLDGGALSAFDYDALVRPLDGAAVPVFDYDALVRPLDVPASLGEAKGLGIVPVELSGTGLDSLLQVVAGLESGALDGSLDLSGAFATTLSQVPDAVWADLVAQMQSQPNAYAAVTLAQEFFSDLAQFPLEQIDVESAVVLVGFDGLDAVLR